MRQRQRVAVVLLVGCLGLLLGRASAQSSIPDGVFVRDGAGVVWLVLGGQRVYVPIWAASDLDVAALPASDRWAVMNDAGAIVAGDQPAWYGSKEAPVAQASPAVPLVPVGRQILSDLAGQQVTGKWGGQPYRATIVEATTMQVLPESGTREWGTFDRRPAQGMWLVFLTKIENIGNQATCCLPHYRVRDARGRFFTGFNSIADYPVKQATGGIYPWVTYQSGDYQPNVPVQAVFVFDVAPDATGVALVPDE